MVSDGENNFMQNKYNKWMWYINILPGHKKYQFVIIYNSFSWCRHDRNCSLNINYRDVFLYHLKTHK